MSSHAYCQRFRGFVGVTRFRSETLLFEQCHLSVQRARPIQQFLFFFLFTGASTLVNLSRESCFSDKRWLNFSDVGGKVGTTEILRYFEALKVSEVSLQSCRQCTVFLVKFLGSF